MFERGLSYQHQDTTVTIQCADCGQPLRFKAGPRARLLPLFAEPHDCACRLANLTSLHDLEECHESF